jgi:hypothetical protein
MGIQDATLSLILPANREKPPVDEMPAIYRVRFLSFLVNRVARSMGVEESIDMLSSVGSLHISIFLLSQVPGLLYL